MKGFINSVICAGGLLVCGYSQASFAINGFVENDSQTSKISFKDGTKPKTLTDKSRFYIGVGANYFGEKETNIVRKVGEVTGATKNVVSDSENLNDQVEVAKATIISEDKQGASYTSVKSKVTRTVDGGQEDQTAEEETVYYYFLERESENLFNVKVQSADNADTITNPDSYDYHLTSLHKLKEREFGSNIFFGYQANRYFAIEAGFSNLGDIDYQFVINTKDRLSAGVNSKQGSKEKTIRYRTFGSSTFEITSTDEKHILSENYHPDAEEVYADISQGDYIKFENKDQIVNSITHPNTAVTDSSALNDRAKYCIEEYVIDSDTIVTKVTEGVASTPNDLTYIGKQVIDDNYLGYINGYLFAPLNVHFRVFVKGGVHYYHAKLNTILPEDVAKVVDETGGELTLYEGIERKERLATLGINYGGGLELKSKHVGLRAAYTEYKFDNNKSEQFELQGGGFFSADLLFYF